MSLSNRTPGGAIAGEPPLPSSTDGWAFFFDVDGTLIDLAPTPDAVIVPVWMPAALRALSVRAGGALALVTGRSIPDIDRLFDPEKFAAAGLHGGDVRLDSGPLVQAPRAASLDGLRATLGPLAAGHPGVLVEDKGAGIAVHFRAVPELGPVVAGHLERFVAGAGGQFAVQHGKMVVEVRLAASDKGRAVQLFMDQPGFAGRRPLVIGDDLTDESMFEVAEARGGRAVRVGAEERDSAASARISGAPAVRDWLRGIAA